MEKIQVTDKGNVMPQKKYVQICNVFKSLVPHGSCNFNHITSKLQINVSELMKPSDTALRVLMFNFIQAFF